MSPIKTLFLELLFSMIFISAIQARGSVSEYSSLENAEILTPPFASPSLDNPNVWSRHMGNDQGDHNYELVLSASVSDPEGLSDIASVIVTGPTGITYTLADPESDGWYDHWTGSLSAPPELGLYTFRVTDKTGYWVEATDILTAVLDYPRNVSPAYNSVIASSIPEFKWDAVAGAVTYNVEVTEENGNYIWSRYNITSNTVLYNDDFTATQNNLIDKACYKWGIRCQDADGNTGEQYFWIPFVYSSDLNAPILTNISANTAHYGDDLGNSEYVLTLNLQAFDPQGLNDIATVTAIGPDAKTYTLSGNSDGSYHGWFSGLSSPPQAGTYIIHATDKSGNWAESTKIITGNIDYPRNVYPAQNDFVTTSTPTFSWDAVADAVNYNLWVDDINGRTIWNIGGLTSTSVIYNENGQANESLKNGTIYTWHVNAYDSNGNWGEHYGNRFTYSTDPAKPVISNNYAVTYHGGDDLGNEEYGYDFGINVADPQGLSDIASVSFKTFEGIYYPLTDNDNDGRYDGNVRGLSSPATLGQCIFTVTDKSNNIATILDTLTAWIPVASNLNPSYNEIIETNLPVMSWNAVADISYYQLHVWINNGSNVWGGINITNQTSVTYNYDNSGQDIIEGNSYNWDIRTFDADGNYGYHYPVLFTYSTSVSNPVLSNQSVLSVCYGDPDQIRRYLVLRIQSLDPQGIDDIASLTVTDPEGTIYTLTNANNGWYDNWFGGTTEFPLPGEYKFIATDKSGNTTEVVDTLKASLDCPQNVVPSYNDVITTPNPIFSWDPVDGADAYNLWVYNFAGNQIWGNDNIKTTSIVYNSDGSASATLENGNIYSWTIQSSDADGSWGERSNIRFAYSTDPELPILNNNHLRSRYWVNNDFSESWGIDFWIYAADPQGMDDIDSVWVDGPENYHLRLFDNGETSDDSPNDGKFGYSIGGMNTPPEIGEYIFKVVDKSGNLVTIKDTLKIVLDYPRNITPQHNAVITDPEFTISWDPVEGATMYEISVNSPDWSNTYWYSGWNITQTSVRYGGSELSDGDIFFLTVRARDSNEGNESERNSIKIAYRINERRIIYADSLNISGTENGTSDFPFNTVRKAVTASVAGDTILVSPGSYVGQIENISGLTLIGENPATTIIRGFLALTSGKVRVSGFTIKNSDRSGIEIHENVDAEISNNIIVGSAGSGITHGWNGPSNSIIKQNTIVKNQNEGIAVETVGSEVVITNNIIANNSNRGIYNVGETTILNSYNDLWDNSENFYNLSAGEGEIFTDPLFVNASWGNYELQETSQCIDAGHPDLDGDGSLWIEDPDDSDPDSTQLDMGALFFDQRVLIPDPPLNLSAVSCNNLVTLNWQKNSSLYFKSYWIYADFNNSPTIKIDSTSDDILQTTKVISGLTKGETYFFRVITVNRGGTKSDFSSQVSVTVQSGVIPKIKLKWGDVLICSNTTDSITNYQWYKGDNAVSNGNKQYYVTNGQSGDYKIVSTDIIGCKNSSDIISVSGKKSISVYPNPVSKSFSLDITEDLQGTIVINILNSSGIRVMQLHAGDINDGILKEIPVSNLENGVYFVQVVKDKQELFFERIIVIK